MTRLERRCRLLLRLYPAAYRRDRGDEIIGTLLDSTPAGRGWPPLRDVRALVLGGLHARAALSRQRTTSANLREAVLVGVTACFCMTLPGAFVALDRYEALRGTAFFWAGDWPWNFIPLILAATAALVWVSRSRLLVLLGVLPAAAVVLYAASLPVSDIGSTVTDLACLAALAVAGGARERPSPRWLWALGLIIVIASAPQVSDFSLGSVLWGIGILALIALSLARLAIDARPAIAMAVCVLAVWLPISIDTIRFGFEPLAGLPLLVTGLVGAGAFWRLRRQSGLSDRRTG